MFENQLVDKLRKVEKLKNRLSVVGVSSLLIATGIYMYTGLSNDAFIPESMVCFRPEIRNDFSNTRYSCDREARVKIILSGLNEYWTKKDIFWSTKIASGKIKDFDSNIDNSLNYLALSSVLALLSSSCFGYRLYLTQENKNLAYNLKRVEIFNNDTIAQGAIRLEQEKVANIFRHEPSIIEQKLMFRELEMKVAEYEEKIALSELDKVKHLSEREAILERANTSILMVATQTKLPEVKGIDWWDWNLFKSDSHTNIPHVRVVGATGTGKTMLVSLLMQEYFPGQNMVVSPKADPNKNLFGNLPVVGIPERWNIIHAKIQEIIDTRLERNKIIHEEGEDGFNKLESMTYLLDESKDTREGMGIYFVQKLYEETEDTSKITPQKIKAAKELGYEYYESFARSMIRQSRAAKIRLILTAVSEYLGTWGLKGETDLVDSFVNIFLGIKAHDKFESYINKKSFLTPEEKEEAHKHLASYGHRAMYIECGLGVFCGVVPEIKFKKSKPIPVED
jgi:hypothetical protein